jgi:hypothetical protein
MQFPLVLGTQSGRALGVHPERLDPQQTVTQAANGLGNSPSQLPTPPNEGLLLPTGIPRIARSHAAVNQVLDFIYSV